MNSKKSLEKINNFIEDSIDKTKSYVWQKGYSTLGILLVGFCEWIHTLSKEAKIDKLFFLSREGYIIRKAYKIMYPNEKCGYLYTSRKSLSLPSMKFCKNAKEKLDYLVLPPMFTIETLLSVLDIHKKEYDKVLDYVKIKKEEIFYRNSFKKDERIVKLIEKLDQYISLNINTQYTNFKKYLEQEGFKGKVGIVDIGWHNSMQKSLLSIVQNTKIKGYYLGVYKEGIVFNNGNEAKGYLYSYGDNIERQYKTFSFVSLFETMLLAHEGTTKGYKESKGKISPILAEYEYKDEKESLKIVEEFQAGAIKFVKAFKDNKNINIELNPEICSYNLLKFGSNPSKKDINVFGKLSFENYQKNNVINFNRSSLYYFLHLKKMKEDFYKSGWRVAFLKKLFKIPLPYFKIMEALCVLLKKD